MNETASQPRTTTTGSTLRARDIHRTYQMGESIVHVLKGADFTLRPGEFVAIEGRSGSGKSTLLHVLAGLESVSSGSITFDDFDYTTLSEEPPRVRHLIRPGSAYQWFRAAQAISWRWLLRGRILVAIIALYWMLRAFSAAFASFAPFKIVSDLLTAPVVQQSFRILAVFTIGALLLLLAVCLVTSAVFSVLYDRRERPRAMMRNREFGFVFQFYHLLPELDVVENTLLAPMIEKSSVEFAGGKSALRERAVALLTQLGMSHRLKHRPSQLSGGERQRVAIARALMNNPKVLFADEPTGNLDADTGRQIMNLLEKLHRDHNQTIVMVTHDRALAREADRVLVLKDGKLEKAE